MNALVKICISLYRRLARAFPHEFWMIYGQDLERLGEDAAPEIWRRHGVLGLLRFLVDIAIRLPIEYFAEFRQDAIYAARTLASSPGVTAVAILSLTLGMGVCVTFFTQINWITRPILIYRDPQSLVAIEVPVSFPQFERFRSEKGIAESTMAFMGPVPFAVGVNGSERANVERVNGHLVSTEYFSTLGVSPAAGRLFDPDRETKGADPVIVISERFWRRNFDSDPQAVGRTL